MTASYAVSASWAPQSVINLSGYLSSSWTGSNISQFAGTASYATVAQTALNTPTASTALTSSYFYRASGSGAWKIYIEETYGDLVFDFS